MHELSILTSFFSPAPLAIKPRQAVGFWKEYGPRSEGEIVPRSAALRTGAITHVSTALRRFIPSNKPPTFEGIPGFARPFGAFA